MTRSENKATSPVFYRFRSFMKVVPNATVIKKPGGPFDKIWDPTMLWSSLRLFCWQNVRLAGTPVASSIRSHEMRSQPQTSTKSRRAV